MFAFEKAVVALEKGVFALEKDVFALKMGAFALEKGAFALDWKRTMVGRACFRPAAPAVTSRCLSRRG